MFTTSPCTRFSTAPPSWSSIMRAKSTGHYYLPSSALRPV
jgi:hypothetical protein